MRRCIWRRSSRLCGAGRTVSDELLDRYKGSWHGDINHIFEEFAF